MSHPIRTPEPSSVQVLPRVLGPFDAITIVVGSIIGSGVFLKASTIADQFGQHFGFGPTICVWAGMGLVTLCGCLALAELAAMLPHAGGPYVPSKRTPAGTVEVAENTVTASQRLLARHPDAQIWCVRIGHPAVHRFGPRLATEKA